MPDCILRTPVKEQLRNRMVTVEAEEENPPPTQAPAQSQSIQDNQQVSIDAERDAEQPTLRNSEQEAERSEPEQVEDIALLHENEDLKEQAKERSSDAVGNRSNVDLQRQIDQLKEHIIYLTEDLGSAIQEVKKLKIINSSTSSNQIMQSSPSLSPSSQNNTAIPVHTVVSQPKQSSVITSQMVGSTLPTLGESNHFRPRKPDPFSGDKSKNPTLWIQQMQRYLKLSNHPSELYTEIAATFLDRDAAQWWEGELMMSHSEENHIGWEEFKRLFLQRFQPIAASQIALTKLTQWKQTGSLDTYINGFLSTSSNIPLSTLPEQARVTLFINGLRPEIGSIASIKEPKTIQEAINVAQRYVGFKSSASKSQARSVTSRSTLTQSVVMKGSTLMLGGRPTQIVSNLSSINSTMLTLKRSLQRVKLRQVSLKVNPCGHKKPYYIY